MAKAKIKPYTYRWFGEEEVALFTRAFIIKASELSYAPDIIGEYLALFLTGLEEARSERIMEEE